MRIALAILLSMGSLTLGLAQQSTAPRQNAPLEIGLAIGQKAPAFSLRDQFGRVQTNETLKGTKGTVLLFFRSADWWPYCKGQLVQLQNAKRRFEQQGLRIAAISYDSVEILKSFSARRHIEFPMLADPDSRIIRAYHVLNEKATGMRQGMALPGYFVIDPRGIIREKFFEDKYQERFSPNNVVGKLFPELGEEVSGNVPAPHIRLTLEQSDRSGFPGSRISLIVHVRLPDDVHVYSPGVEGYKPIELTLNPSPALEPASLSYPQAKVLYLPVIQERVPVFEGDFRIVQDIKVNSSLKFSDALPEGGKNITVRGTLKYQACDTKICYLPVSVPLKWELHVLRLDHQRAPEAIRHR